MRRVLALLLMTLTLASPAGAAGPAPKQVQPPKKVIVAPPVTTPSVVLQSPIPLASAAPSGDAGQCRSSCARSYYFCNAQEDGECPSKWAQCSARCTATYKRAGS
jgi:hypothetical protein